MIRNLLAPQFEASSQALRQVLQAQSNVRLGFGLAVAALGYLIYSTSARVEPGFTSWATLLCFLYALVTFLAVRRLASPALPALLLATAVLDPWVLSVTIVLSGTYGGLVGGFYVFTMLGFGFRAGPRLMHINQAAAIAGFIVVFLSQRFWQEHWIMWLSLLTPMAVVPVYAGNLMRKLHAARELAEQQTRAKSDLLAKVSHELRTPLTGIVTAMELLQKEVSDPRVTRRTRTVLALTDTLLSEINDLLDQAKYDAQKATISPQRVDLLTRVEQSLRVYEDMANDKGLTFDVRLDDQIVDDVSTDGHLIERVLHNLVGNAIKFTDSGSVEVDVRLLSETQDQYQVYFSVADTGIGIPESFRARVFEPFAQADSGSERRYGGTGLGLALSRRIVEMLGGQLQFKSVEGGGTRFWFELLLPRLAAEEPQAVLEDDTPTTGLKILVAEDNHTNLMLLKELLEVDNHIVTTCTSGIEALELLTKTVFDVLLLDYNLGDMDGVRVLQTYKFGTPHTSPVIFLTADATPATATRLYEAGSAAILYKPVSLTQIRDALSDAVDDQAVSSPAETIPVADIGQAPKIRPTLTVVPVAALDRRTLERLKEVSKRPEFVPQLLASAEHDIARSCELLQDALAGKTNISVRETAHALKGVCINIGAMRLVALASNLMRASSDELEQSGDRLASDLREAHQMTVQSLRQAIAESSTSPANGGLLHSD